MLELNDPFDCFVKGLGDCIALFIISGGSIHGNPQFMVRIHNTGDLRVVDMRDMRTYGNPSAGQPLVPEGISQWKNESKPEVKKHQPEDVFVANIKDITMPVPENATQCKNESKPEVKKHQPADGIHIVNQSEIPDIVFDHENKHIKIIGDHTLDELYRKLLRLYIDVEYDKWTVSGQHETYINLPKGNSFSSTYYRIGEQNQNLPTETICE